MQLTWARIIISNSIFAAPCRFLVGIKFKRILTLKLLVGIKFKRILTLKLVPKEYQKKQPRSWDLNYQFLFLSCFSCFYPVYLVNLWIIFIFTRNTDVINIYMVSQLRNSLEFKSENFYWNKDWNLIFIPHFILF